MSKLPAELEECSDSGCKVAPDSEEAASVSEWSAVSSEEEFCIEAAKVFISGTKFVNSLMSGIKSTEGIRMLF